MADEEFENPADIFPDFSGMSQIFKDIDSKSKAITRKPVEGQPRSKVLDHIDEAFELVGGVPRLAIWAHNNPSKFFPIYLRTAPSQANIAHSGEVGLRLLRPPLPPSPLDSDFTEGDFTDVTPPKQLEPPKEESRAPEPAAKGGRVRAAAVRKRAPAISHPSDRKD